MKALFTDFFSDAQIVWVMPGTNDGKGGWSANSETAARLQALTASDASYYVVADKADIMLHASDVLWVKF